MRRHQRRERGRVAVGRVVGQPGRLDADHLLLALVEQKDGVVPPLLDRIGVDPAELAQALRAGLAGKPKVHGDAAQLTMAPRLSKVLNRAEQEADGLKDEFTSTEHLFLAMLEAEGDVRDILRKRGVTREAVMEGLRMVRGNAKDKYQVYAKLVNEQYAAWSDQVTEPVLGPPVYTWVGVRYTYTLPIMVKNQASSIP